MKLHYKMATLRVRSRLEEAADILALMHQEAELHYAEQAADWQEGAAGRHYLLVMAEMRGQAQQLRKWSLPDVGVLR